MMAGSPAQSHASRYAELEDAPAAAATADGSAQDGAAPRMGPPWMDVGGEEEGEGDGAGLWIWA